MDGSEYDSIAYAKEDGPEEKKEVFIISLSNTCSDPWAMMVKALNAAATESAVNCSWRSINVTVFTVFDSSYSTIENIHVFLHTCFLVRVVNSSLICFQEKSLKFKIRSRLK